MAAEMVSLARPRGGRAAQVHPALIELDPQRTFDPVGDQQADPFDRVDQGAGVVATVRRSPPGMAGVIIEKLPFQQPGENLVVPDMEDDMLL